MLGQGQLRRPGFGAAWVPCVVRSGLDPTRAGSGRAGRPGSTGSGCAPPRTLVDGLRAMGLTCLLRHCWTGSSSGSIARSPPLPASRFIAATHRHFGYQGCLAPPDRVSRRGQWLRDLHRRIGSRSPNTSTVQELARYQVALPLRLRSRTPDRRFDGSADADGAVSLTARRQLRRTDTDDMLFPVRSARSALGSADRGVALRRRC